MRHFLYLSFLFLAWNPAFSDPPSRIALIVAVGQYPESSGWSSLGAANDLQLVRDALMQQRFPEENIAGLQDEVATKAGIVQAFRHHLINKARPGDIAVFHFSGHGQQVMDDNGDELDGFDEALVPYDSPQDFQPGIYEGERLLKDDELNALLIELRRKLGKEGQVLVLLDACHSGTATRGYAPARGSWRKMAPPPYLEKAQNNPPDTGQFQEEAERNAGKQAPLIAFFASAASQLNYEYRDEGGNSYGPLSYAFSKVFPTLERQVTYGSFFSRIKQEMAALAPRQAPWMEGPSELAVLGGYAAPAPQHLEVLRWYGPQTLIVDAGTLKGIHAGTAIRLFPSGTRDTAGVQPITRGVVSNAFPLISEVSLEGDIDEEAAAGAWGFVERQNYGSIRARLMVAPGAEALQPALLSEAAAYAALQLVRSQPDIVLEQEEDENGHRKLLLRSRDDYVLWASPLEGKNPEALAEQAVKRCLAYAQAEFLRKLEMDNRFLEAEMELIPVTVKRENRKFVVDEKLPLSSKAGPDGVVRFREGESFIIRVTNRGVRPVYYSVLDVQADNQVQPLIPNPVCGLGAADYYIQPGQTQELDCIIDVYPPYGNEALKLIATEEPLELRRIISTRGEAAGSNNPFEQLFQSTFKDAIRGPTTPSIPPSSAHVHSVLFRIVER